MLGIQKVKKIKYHQQPKPQQARVVVILEEGKRCVKSFPRDWLGSGS